MFSEPGFWIITAGALLVAAGLVGLAFSGIDKDVPVHSASMEEQQAAPTPIELPDPLASDSKTEVAKPFGRAAPKRTGNGDG
jgi:hypothetical protein